MKVSFKFEKTLLDDNISINVIDYLSSLIFSVLSVIGFALKHYGEFFDILNKDISLVFIIFLILIFTFFYKIIIFLIRFTFCSIIQSKLTSSVIRFVFNNNYKRNIFFIILFFWLPYIVINYPAHIEWDAYHGQILGFLNNNINIHHPLLSTILMGGAVKLSSFLFNSYDIGIFIYTLIQSITAILVLTMSIFVLYDIFSNKSCCVMLLLIYCISPIFPGFLTWVVKDAPYSISVFLCIVLMTELLYKDNKKYFLFFVSLLLSILFRKNGIYLAIIWFLFLLFYNFFSTKYQFKFNVILVLFLISIMFGIFFNSFTKRKFAVDKNSDLIETMRIPFQQTSRYVNKYKDQLTDNEIYSINEVLDMSIGSIYNPTLSDPVKSTFHADTKKIFDIYLPIWSQMFLKHPGTYIDATLMNTYCFWYPGQTIKNLGINNHTWSDDEQLRFNEPKLLKPIKRLLNAYLYVFTYVPFFSFFFNCGVSVFIMIYLIIFSLVYKVYRNLVLLMPIIVSFFVCIASPTWSNNGIRYAMPILISIPFLFFIIINEKNNSICYNK